MGDLDAMEQRARAGFRDGAGASRDALALVAEVRALRERVATLETALRDHVDCRVCAALLDVAADDREDV